VKRAGPNDPRFVERPLTCRDAPTILWDLLQEREPHQNISHERDADGRRASGLRDAPPVPRVVPHQVQGRVGGVRLHHAHHSEIGIFIFKATAARARHLGGEGDGAAFPDKPLLANVAPGNARLAGVLRSTASAASSTRTMRSPLIVAELSASHLGSLDRAMAIVSAANEAGADAVKLQTWSEMSVCETPLEILRPVGRAHAAELYEKCRTPWEWHAPIFERCRELGMLGFSTPFDEPSVDFLERSACPIYKIASFEITHLELIRCAWRHGQASHHLDRHGDGRGDRRGGGGRDDRGRGRHHAAQVRERLSRRRSRVSTSSRWRTWRALRLPVGCRTTRSDPRSASRPRRWAPR
jgi:hypothetical protein